MNELHTGDIRWFFDEDTEKAYEVRIDKKESPDGFWNPWYWGTVIETGKESIFEQRFLYESKEEAVNEFLREAQEDVVEREQDLKEYIEDSTEYIKKKKALIEKIKKNIPDKDYF